MEDTNKDAMWFLFEAMSIGDASQAILNQEAKGQRELVNSASLPIDCDRETFEAMGIVFRETIDDLFIQATLPDGWRKEATDHSMWSKLLDEQGRERATIFYKAAFYDRKAEMHDTRRFECHTQRVGGYENREETCLKCVVKDCGIVIWQSDPVEEPQSPDEWQERRAIETTLKEQGTAWLDEHYPNWRDPLAHWD